MADNFIEIIKEIRGSTANPATDVTCIYGDIKQMHTEYEGFSQITTEERNKIALIEPEATKNKTDMYLLSRANHTGMQSADSLTDGVSNVAMTVAERSKLNGISNGATTNASDSQLRDRSTHTGTQSADTITPGSTNGVFTLVEKSKLASLSNTINDSNITNVNWSKLTNIPLTFSPSSHIHNMSDITTGNLSATRITETLDLQFVDNAEKSRISNSEILSNKGVPYGYAPLDGNGKINSSYLNDLNLLEVFTPVNMEAMLSITTAQPGDIAYIQDIEDSYMLIALPTNILANWKKLNSGAAGVVSVNGQTGVVSIGSDDIQEGLLNKYYTDERVDDRVNSLLKAGTNISLAYDDGLNELTINANDVSVEWYEIQNKPDPTISVNISGDISGSGSVTLTDLNSGTLNISNMTLESAGTAGTYRSVTTDSSGRVVSGSNPTTIAGYAITDAYTKAEIQTILPKIGFDITNIVIPSPGQVAWNIDENTLDLGLNGATLQIGQEQLIRVRNNTGSSISNGSVIMATGTLGNSGRITVAPANLTQANAKYILGVVTESISAGADGFCTTFGKVRGINTTGSIYGESWNDGDILYAKDSGNGALTKVVPTDTQVKLPIAIVIHAHTSGTLFVRVNSIDENHAKVELATKAPIASPSLTGIPTAPTAVVGTNTTQIATTAYVMSEINKIEEW